MMKYAIAAYAFASGGGTLGYQSLAPTAAKADNMVDERLAQPITSDANDFIYQWEASHDYNPSAGVVRVGGMLVASNSAHDPREPPPNRPTHTAPPGSNKSPPDPFPAATQTTG